MEVNNESDKNNSFLFNGGHLNCEEGWLRKLHSHSFYQILIIYRGCLTIDTGRSFKTKPGDVVFYPRNIPHKEANNEKETAEIIYLDWEGPMCNFPEIVHDNEGRIRILAEWLLSDYRHSLYSKQDEIENSLLQTLLLEIDKNANNHTDSFIRNIRAEIYKNINNPLSLDILSAAFGMNKFTFSKKYRKLTGRTPIEEVRLIRLERARDLVISTDLTFNDIASRTGLTNEYHLSRIFKKYLNVPPGYFRKNY